MVTEFVRAIVNRASKLWETILLMHRWVLHRAIWTCGFLSGYIASYLEGPTGNDGDNDNDSDDVVAMTHKIPCLHVRVLQRSASTKTMTTQSGRWERRV
eukprot:6345915-Amphidinium_carterae.3